MSANIRTMTPADVKSKATRKAFGEALKALGDENDQILVFDADLAKSTQSQIFAKAHPERFFEMGIAEANMIGTAAGAALCGYTPFICSFACFITGRFDQIKMSVAYSQARVRIIGTHAGVGIGPDGYSQQGLEDLACMRSLPTMLVLQPGDDLETEQMIKSLATDERPAYVRLTRQNVPRVHADDYQFKAGVFPQLIGGEDLTIFATGGTVGHAVAAAIRLHGDGIKARVVNASSIKPVDVEAIRAAATQTKAIVTVEDHNVLGGMGSAISEVVTDVAPTRVKRLGVQDIFGESGTPDGLYAHHGLNADGIHRQVTEFAKSLS
jgi:transketolase